MHNVKRVPHSKEAIQARKEREKSQIAAYIAITEDVLTRKKSCDWSRDALDQTQRLLELNPEFYTVWNYRRNIMLNGIFPQSTPEDNNDLLADELSMTMAALREHPKVYWIWNHRRWCLENVPDGPTVDGEPSLQWRKANWQRELAVVEKMLDTDARNFLAWNYRRYVLASMPDQRPLKTELAYTTRKIGASFSNFSAWHQRSRVYSSLWTAGELDPVRSREEEFDLVHNALFTDPDDQSAWIYHRWLIGTGENKEQLQQEIAIIEELLTEQPDSKWCMESLVYYNRLLLKNHRPDSGSEDIKQTCLGFLQQLERIDSPRKTRYREIGKSIALGTANSHRRTHSSTNQRPMNSSWLGEAIHGSSTLRFDELVVA